MPSERKNMEGRERKKSLKTSILFLCRSLASVGVGSISPEDVRQAKFNVDGPRIQLWKALHDLVVLSQNNFCGKVARALKAQSREQAEVVIEYATVQLDVLGCPFISAFDHPARVGSRRLLLALAWLIARTKVLEVIMERAIHNLEKASPVTHCPTISPQDTLFCHHTAQRCERAHSEARTFVEAIKAEGKNHSLWGAVDLRANQVLLLSGKVRAQINKFLCMQTGYMRKMNKLRKSQRPPEEPKSARGPSLGDKVKGPPTLSCFDVHLLASKKRVEGYAKHLEDTIKTVSFLREFAFHVHDFLTWIASVKDLHTAAVGAGEEDNRGGGALASLAGMEAGGFEVLGEKIRERVLTRVVVDQRAEAMSDTIAELAALNSEGARELATDGEDEFSVDILGFLVNLERSAASDRSRSREISDRENLRPLGARDDGAFALEEKLADYREALLGLSRAQAKIRAHHALQLDGVAKLMDALDITERQT